MKRADSLPTTTEPPPCALGESRPAPSQGQAPSSTASLSGKGGGDGHTQMLGLSFCKTVSRAEAGAGPLAPTDATHNAKSPGSRKLSQLPFATVYYFLIDR